MSTQRAFSIDEAAAAYGVSPDTIRRAIHATDPAKFPPPLKANRKGKSGPYSIHVTDLDAWHASWPAA